MVNIGITTFDGDVEGELSIPKSDNISYAKVFVWKEDMQPLGGVENVIIE